MSDNTQSAEKKRIRIAVALVYFCMGLCFASWASRIPDIKTALHLNDGLFGSILFALPVGQFLMMPFSGKLVTRFGSRRVILLALPLYTICLSNIGLVKHGWQLAIALFLFGLAGNLCNISINTQGVATERLYGRPIMATFHGGWSLAGFTGALTGLLMINLKVAPYWHFLTVISVVWIIVWINHPYLNKGRIGANKNEPKRKFFSRPDSVLLQLGIIGFCSMASEGAMFDWSGIYFKDVVISCHTRLYLIHDYDGDRSICSRLSDLQDRKAKAASDKRSYDFNRLTHSCTVSISYFLYYFLYAGWLRCIQYCTYSLQCSWKTRKGAGRNCTCDSFKCEFSRISNGSSPYWIHLRDCRP